MADCYFCKSNIREVDWKDVETLRRFMSASGKIASRARRPACAKHQRKIARAIKRARQAALLPYVVR